MSENLLDVTDDNFEKEVIKSDKLTVIDFWAEWCAPCIMMTPVIEELAKEYEGKAKIGKFNVDENPKVSAQFGIRGIPTLLFFKNGKVLNQLVGVQPKGAIKQILDDNI